MLEAIDDLLTKGVGTYAGDVKTFKKLMGLAEGDDILLTSNYGHYCSSLQLACSGGWHTGPGDDPPLPSDKSYVAVDREALADEYADAKSKGITCSDYETYFKYAFMHELGHIMGGHSARSDYKSVFVDDSGGVSNYGKHNQNEDGSYDPIYRQDEDWAETVAVTIYPGVIISVNEGDHSVDSKNKAATERRKQVVRNYLRSFLPYQPGY